MRRLLLIASIGLGASAAFADSSCKPVLDSMTHYLHSPSHMVTRTTRRAGAQPDVGETIHAGTQRYVRIGGTWRVSPISDADMLQQTQENAANSTCRVLREETVNGEASVVYEVSRQDDDANSRGEYFISKRTGLPLKEELDIGAPGDASRVHLSVTVDYQNVQAPQLGK